MKNLYCIVGPSGSGKTSAQTILEKFVSWMVFGAIQLALLAIRMSPVISL